MTTHDTTRNHGWGRPSSTRTRKKVGSMRTGMPATLSRGPLAMGPGYGEDRGGSFARWPIRRPHPCSGASTATS